MKVESIRFDRRIDAHNVLFNFSVGEYLDAVRDIVEKNEFQRKKLSGSKGVYSLLREDLIKDCVIPPIVLALSHIEYKGENLSPEVAQELVKRHSQDLLILDGLQRTYTLLSIEKDLPSDQLPAYLAQSLRVEIYIGINRLGILYRMLTLNTGQTPMSLRQQIEMLYSDYLQNGVEGIRFVREVDEQYATEAREYNFKDTIEGFNSYLERNELPLERADILENVKGLLSLSQENSSKDVFREFVSAWLSFIDKVTELCHNFQLTVEDIDEGNAVWGKSVLQIFKRSQAFTGFGAAMGKLRDLDLLESLSQLNELSAHLHLGDGDARDFILSINQAVKWLNLNTKKIGNAQRMFFYYFFRELYNRENDSFRNLPRSVTSALHKVQTQLF
jgi:hypothetical protein